MNFHTGLATLKANKDVSIKWSKTPQRKAIVFVHGYSGHTTKTWTEFDRLLSEETKAADYDLFFYGYDGVRGTVNFLANDFRAFLGELFKNPPSLNTNPVRLSIGVGPLQPYDQVVVVAHSLGAVVSRWALAMAASAGDPWVAKTKLALFAPAHNGSHAAELLRLGSSSFSFLRYFVPAVFYYSPLIQELAPGSRTLTTFAGAVQTASTSTNGASLTAQLVIHANRERVVINGPFLNDPPPAFTQYFRTATHTSVCKPTRYFPAPLTALRSIL